MSNYIAPRLNGIAENLALYIRKIIYKKTIGALSIDKTLKVGDLGVTSDKSKDSNFFEMLYPYPENITAIGLEDAKHLEKMYPGLKFVHADVCNLPFPDKLFDISFCSAVIEHVGSRDNQCKLITEAMRTSHIVVLTTPNRYFPIEFHTLTPFLHWLPKRIFRTYLRIIGKKFWSLEENLNILSDFEIVKMLESNSINYTKYHVRLLGIVSNLVYILR
ncbi:MAG: methyltransferase domain-containing protein [Synechococcus sp. MIT S9220]|uniref:methyltransferase domain-containing protein n=1 Tax=unclassified Synechococcus TaxID=2626047 RepID=UPI0017DE1D4C|nr:methyltransferase domain-containing protein [Synechococcus sp. MIT S9220]NOL48091.1 methyltransferase domain-containing protein [Synechococcus sp. MIT S9220]